MVPPNFFIPLDAYAYGTNYTSILYTRILVQYEYIHVRVYSLVNIQFM